MPKNIFAYIFKYSMKQQIIAFMGTLIYLPVLYISFELPKIIVNDTLDADPSSFPRDLFGHSIEQIPYLFTLCAILLALVLITGGLRYVMSVYKGVLGEIMLRRLRYDLYTRILRFPLTHLKKIQGGEIVTMITAEAEPLGRYMGVAVANPTLQGGTMITALVFLFAQDWLLGIAAISLFPVQAYLVPKLQARLNAWSRIRIENVRLFAGHISETIDSYSDIHVHDTSAYEMSKAADRLGILFRTRRSLYKTGNVIIFVNNFFTQLTPFMFYSIGGYLVITGELTLGALIAVIAAYRETAAPWNDLLENYQSLEDNRIKYAALVENFSPEGMREIPDCNRPEKPENRLHLKGDLALENVTVKDGEEVVLNSISLQTPLPGNIAILGPAGSGKMELAQLLSTLRRPISGGISLAGQNISALSQVSLGRCFSYLDQDAHVFTGTWRDNIYYGLMHRPFRAQNTEISEKDCIVRALEAAEAGNTINDFGADWVDFEDAGFANREELDQEAIRIARHVGLNDAVLEAGMRASVDTAVPSNLIENLLNARKRFRELLCKTDFSDAVEFSDPELFNTNASVMENLLFGQIQGAGMEARSLAAHPFVVDALERGDLLEAMIKTGHIAASNIVSMFSDLPEGDDRLSRFSVIDPDSIPEFEVLLRRIPKIEGIRLNDEDQALFLSVAFTLTPAQHRLGLIDQEKEKKLVAARKLIIQNLPADLAESIAIFNPDAITVGDSVRANIIFGHLARHRAQHRDDVEAIMAQVIAELSLADEICALGLDSFVGVAGAKLAPAEKQKVALARCLIKKPQLLIVNEALTAVEPDEQETLRRKILEDRPERSLIWIDRERTGLDGFDHTFIMRGGRVVEERGPDNQSVKAFEKTPQHGKIIPPTGSFNDDIQVLSEVPMLSQLSPETLKLIAYTGDKLTFSEGEVLFHEGEIGETAFIIAEGAVEVVIGSGDNARVLFTHGPGTIVGEMAILSNTPRTATIRAEGDLKVLRLSRYLFFELMRRDVNLGLAVMQGLSDRLVKLTSELENTKNSGDMIE